jgi:predicted tellurium resistance membrane protein TerC
MAILVSPLYFALAAMLGKFRFLKNALVVVLAFVGIKMLIVNFTKFQFIKFGCHSGGTHCGNLQVPSQRKGI